MTHMTPSELFADINGPLLKEQRALINDLAAKAHYPVVITAEQQQLLEGLSNFLDCVADIAHDQFGIDCLFTGPEDTA